MEHSQDARTEGSQTSGNVTAFLADVCATSVVQRVGEVLYRMLLSVPLCTPFTQYRGCGDVGASVASFDTQRQRSLRQVSGGGDVKQLASVPRLSAPKRRSCAVFATGKDAAGGLPASREVSSVSGTSSSSMQA